MGDEIDPGAKAEIALAVKRALSEYGYERLTTAKIAEEYEKSEAGLYYHFESKDEMIGAFLEFAAGNLRERLAEIEASDPEAKLRAACEHLFLSPDDEDVGVHIAVMELLSHAPHNDTLRGPLRELESETIDTFAAIVREGIEEGVFRRVDPEATAAFLVAAADGSTGIHAALELDIGDDLRRGYAAYIDSLLVEG